MADVAQVTAYAEAKRCRNAVLIYPIPLRNKLDDQIGDIRVRSLVFRLDGDLENAGRELLEHLLGNHPL